ncbi:hypothetical protein [Flavobacterium frigoris]|uniref:hypothetical protein n=1 Tax=Flavobacterium frigoris TaxID=229204 RepID=UPI00058EB520|nr:hypothetical protein [Flavobacterium frigoris]
MYINSKIDQIVIDNDRLHITYKSGTKNDILISDLKDIFITVNKINPLYEFAIIMSSIIIALFAFFHLQANLILIISSLLIILTIVKTNNYKRYGIKINLKNGISIIKRIPLKSKNDTIDFVNEVKKKVYNSKIEKSNIL